MNHNEETLKAANDWMMSQQQPTYPNAFLAGYEYKQREIDELTSQLQKSEETNVMDLIIHQDMWLRKQEEINELVQALDNLFTAQNGPPLVREQKYWQSCMDKAYELIQKHKK